MPIQSCVYYRHIDLSLMRKLDDLFGPDALQDHKFSQLAKRVHSSQGHLYAAEYLRIAQHFEHSLPQAQFQQSAGFSIISFRHKQHGDIVINALVNFLKQLVPDLNIQAWGYDAEKAWEYWLKFEEKTLRCEQNQFHPQAQQDLSTIHRIYHWWHQDLPEILKTGLMNQQPSLLLHP